MEGPSLHITVWWKHFRVIPFKLHNYDENKHVTYRESPVMMRTMLDGHKEGDVNVEKEVDERIATCISKACIVFTFDYMP